LLLPWIRHIDILTLYNLSKISYDFHSYFDLIYPTEFEF
jgi:hypothetical protein